MNISNDDLKFGCEFEFIVNDNNHDIIVSKLKNITTAEVEVFSTDKPTTDKEYKKMHYKLDHSLESKEGREISTPICSYQELKMYIMKINIIIEKYATTNELTGFHIHISKKIDSQDTLNFLRFALHSNQRGLLNTWGTRNEYCMNVMGIYSHLDKEEAKDFKEHYGRRWNLHKYDSNWIEIRTIGGTNYHKYSDRILIQLKWFIDIFRIASSPPTELCEVLKQEHMKIVALRTEEETMDYLEVYPFQIDEYIT